MAEERGGSRISNALIYSDLVAGFYDASDGQPDDGARRRATIDRMLSLEGPADDWPVMKAQILEDRYPPLPE